MGTTSIREVAERAGVSVGTVSNVLNRPDQVSDTTRDRVLMAIDELQFVRNASARHAQGCAGRPAARGRRPGSGAGRPRPIARARGRGGPWPGGVIRGCAPSRCC